MRIKTVLLAFVTLAATSLPLAAAQAQAKIGVVNVARLLQEAPQAQAASQALENEFLEDLNVRRNEALGQLQRSVLQEVQAYAKTAGLDLVIADALYASQSIDITAQVLAALQAKGRAPAKP